MATNQASKGSGGTQKKGGQIVTPSGRHFSPQSYKNLQRGATRGGHNSHGGQGNSGRGGSNRGNNGRGEDERGGNTEEREMQTSSSQQNQGGQQGRGNDQGGQNEGGQQRRDLTDEDRQKVEQILETYNPETRGLVKEYFRDELTAEVAEEVFDAAINRLSGMRDEIFEEVENEDSNSSERSGSSENEERNTSRGGR